MFDLLRRAAQTWVAKLLMVVLVASFGVWGISRSLFEGGSGGSDVVRVGDQRVGPNAFRLAYRRQIAALSQQFHTELTPDQARALGVQQQTLAQVIAGASLDQLASDMSLGLSKDRLAKLIGDDPAFQSVNGKFDRSLFTSRLQNAGINEDDFISERGKIAVRGQIVNAISNGFKAPPVLVDAIKQYHYQTRGIDYLILTNANIDPIKAPSDAILSKWFDGVKQRYRAPEYRKITYVTLQPDNLAGQVNVTDQEIQALFEKDKEKFKIPASRSIEQLTFANKDLANAAEQALKTGTSFDQLVSDQGKKPSDVMLGTFTKDKVPDQSIADAAFAIAKDGGTSPVVEGAFGPVILRVTNIKDESGKNFDEVKDDLRKQIALQKAAAEVGNAHDQFEDLRDSGMSLADAAQKLKLPVATIDVDASGLNPQGEPIKDVPDAQELFSAAFRAEQGAQNVPLTINNTGYLWFRVDAITPSHDRSLSDVHDKAVADWTAEQQKEALAAKATKLKDDAQKGKSLADIATPLGIAVESKAGITRASDDPVLGRAGVAAAFSGPVGTVATAVGADPTTQILLKVTDDNLTPTTDALANEDQQINAIANAAGDDILDEMVSSLQTKYKVTVNRTLADQAASR